MVEYVVGPGISVLERTVETLYSVVVDTKLLVTTWVVVEYEVT